MRRYGKDWAHLALSIFCAAALPLQAGTPGEANEAAIPYVPPSIILEPDGRSEVFIARFFQEVLASDSIVFDKFTGPSSQVSWTQTQDSLGYGAIARFNTEGAGMFARIATDSLRITGMELLPLDFWQDYWEGRVANLFTGTIGNPQEEHIQMASSSYSALRLSWESANQNSGIQWGFRPWRTNPYIYFLARAGHLDGLPLITLEGRAGYKLLGATRMEGRLTFQLPASFRIAGGGSYDPTSGGSGDGTLAHFGFTLERVLSAHALKSEALFYIGFNSDIHRGASNPHQGTYIVAGLSKRW